MKLNKLLRDFYNTELSEHLSWPTFREKAEKYLNDNEINPQSPVEIISGWIMFVGNEERFNEEAKKNCVIRFDNNVECRYNDQHPNAILTHFKLA